MHAEDGAETLDGLNLWLGMELVTAWRRSLLPAHEYRPALSGLEVLQALIGPALGGLEKDAAWTNCGTVTIQ